MKFDYAIGIDEVGRGALAGPLVVVAASFSPAAKPLIDSLGLNDSKKLVPRRRLEIYKLVKNHPGIKWSAARVNPAVIDRLNVGQAANLAATRALLRLIGDLSIAPSRPKVILDGGLYLRSSLLLNGGVNRVESTTLVKADQSVRPVMLASIIAKVIRDLRMIAYHDFYPDYGFALHKGYGTRIHISALKQNGFTEIHRQSFLRKYF